MGVELSLLQAPDISEAFVAWVSGKEFMSCATLVRQDRRLFYKALRLSGWGHCMGNLLKKVMNQSLRWPKIPEKIRLLVRFYRNHTYRKHIVKCLRGQDVDVDALAHFSAQIAKWRYEAVFEVFSSLLALRVISEHHLRVEWFQNVQDRESVHGAIAVAQDHSLWRFVAVSFEHVVEPTEELRRWGMICNCDEHLRMRREDGVKHISCWNSRRLPEAPDRLHTEVDMCNTKARNLKPPQCEGDNALHGEIVNMCRRRGTELRLRTTYIDTVPWSFSRANTVEGAKNA